MIARRPENSTDRRPIACVRGDRFDPSIGATGDCQGRVLRRRPVVADARGGGGRNSGHHGRGGRRDVRGDRFRVQVLAAGAEARGFAETFHSVIGQRRVRDGFHDTYTRYVTRCARDARKFTRANAHEDMRHLAQIANGPGASNPVGAAVRSAYACADAVGRGGDHAPMIADFVREQDGM